MSKECAQPRAAIDEETRRQMSKEYRLAADVQKCGIISRKREMSTFVVIIIFVVIAITIYRNGNSHGIVTFSCMVLYSHYHSRPKSTSLALPCVFLHMSYR